MHAIFISVCVSGSAGSGGLRPQQIQLSGGAGSGTQNIQLLRSVVSQPGTAQAGQTTFLLAPQDKAKGAVQGGKGAAGAAPVYARIITPPSGIRLAAVRPGQPGLQMIQIPQQQQQPQQEGGNGVAQQGDTSTNP